MASEMQSAKSLLRREMQSVLAKVTQENVQRQSRMVTSLLLQNPIYRTARVVSVYLAMPTGELDTSVIVRDLLQRDVSCYVPVFKPGAPEMEMVHVASLADLESFPVNKWGIPEPSRDSLPNRKRVWDEQQLDLVLTPGLIFTKAGLRCGRGKGYYDRFLSKCATHFPRKPVTIALALEEQIVEDVPVTERDVRMDFVLTASGLSGQRAEGEIA